MATCRLDAAVGTAWGGTGDLRVRMPVEPGASDHWATALATDRRA